MPAPDLDIEKLGAAMASGLRRRSPLMVWFIEQHDEFDALLDKHGAHWKGLAEHFAAAGLVSRTGQPLTPRTVENYWLRARRLVAKRRAEGRPVTAAPASAPAPEPKFEFVRLRNEGRGVSAAERHALGDPTAPADQAAQPAPKFQRSWMRNEGRGVSAAERRALGDPTAPADPDDPKWRGDKSR